MVYRYINLNKTSLDLSKVFSEKVETALNGYDSIYYLIDKNTINVDMINDLVKQDPTEIQTLEAISFEEFTSGLKSILLEAISFEEFTSGLKSILLESISFEEFTSGLKSILLESISFKEFTSGLKSILEDSEDDIGYHNETNDINSIYIETILVLDNLEFVELSSYQEIITKIDSVVF
jgi:hypothetical protein